MTEIERLQEKAYDKGFKDATTEWISVEDKMPEDGTSVLIYGNLLNEDSKGTSCGYYYGEKWTIVFSTFKCLCITHWQPLPEPPKNK